MERSVQLRWLILLVAVFLGVLALHVPRTRGQVYISGDSTATVNAPAPSTENFAVAKNTTVSLGVIATANPNPPTLYDPEASIGGVTWTFTWVSAKVLATDPGSSYDWSAVSAADSSTYETPLTTQTSSTGMINFNFTPKAQGYWHVTVSASATWTEYKNGNVVATHTTSAAFSPATGVTMIAVTPTILVRQHGSSDEYASSVEIAAGHIVDSDAHKADVQVTCSPAVAARVRVDLTGGTGSTSSTNADLVFGSTHIGPGSNSNVTTASDGTLTGVLLSSDVLSGATISGGGTTPATVTFGWDNYGADDKWDLSPSYIVEGDSSDIAVKFAHNGNVMNGHTILFTIEQVVYEDSSGVVQTPLWNTPESPSDLSNWAYFDAATSVTNQTGTADNSIHFNVQSTNHAIWIKLRVYDMTVTGQ
jgi:hypothetical protein